MENIVQFFSFFYQYLDGIAFLILSAAGLAIIFGMMGVINMAHGELMMIGAYITATCIYAEVPWPLAILIAGLGAGLAGIILERLIIRHFYKQLLSSLVVTWGVSMIVSQLFLVLFGPTMESVPTPFSATKILVGGEQGIIVAGSETFQKLTEATGSLPEGVESFGIYRLVLFIVAVAIVFSIWFILTRTEFGSRARATIENPKMANALGIKTERVYLYTFGFGSALAGISGGMFALTSAITPFFGAAYTAKAFIVVVVGGPGVVSGLLSSTFSLAGVQTIFANIFSVYIGFVGMIAAAFVLLLIMPTGISSFLQDRLANRR